VPRELGAHHKIALAFAGFSALGAAIGIFAVATTFSLPACNASESEGGATCPSVTANQCNGETICGDSMCEEGNYCVSDSGSGCAPGCLVTAQCPFGDYCDLTTTTPDLAGNSVGTCLHPTLQQQNGACPDDGGSDASSSSKDAGK
jgi:hypothetical protein